MRGIKDNSAGIHFLICMASLPLQHLPLTALMCGILKHLNFYQSPNVHVAVHYKCVSISLALIAISLPCSLWLVDLASLCTHYNMLIQGTV